MRLTLRTLLSYLDNVLDEPSRAALQRQIDASEHASEWVHRTRDVTRRLKLGAPDPAGTGSIDDPNTVAEYLDRTLPEEGVSEFERVCLESDAMLAEVASCHHVLAMFLNEPSEIDPDTRRRLHRLQEDMAKAAARVEAMPKAPVAAAVQPAEPAAEVPSTRRVKPGGGGVEGATPQSTTPRVSWAQWAPAIAASLLLATTAVLVSQSGGLFGPATPVAIKTDEPQKDPEKTDKVDSSSKADEQTGEESGGGETNDNPSQGTPTEPDEPAEETTPAETTAPEVADPESTPKAEATPDPEATPESTEKTPAVMPSVDPTEGETPAEPETAPDADAVEATVKYFGSPNDLVVAETEAGPWARLVSGDATTQLTHVLALPAYRGDFVLSSGVRVALVGPSEVRVDPENSSVEILYGKVVFQNVSNDDASVSFDVVIDGVDHAAELGPGAFMAIAADRFYQPGRPLLGSPLPTVVVGHALGGEITWSASGVTQALSQPKETFYVENIELAEPNFTSAAWVDQWEPSPRDTVAAAGIARVVPPNSDVWELLSKLVKQSTLYEEQSLAARCCLAMGGPGPIVASFDDELMSAVWPLHLAALRQAAARSPEGAESVRSAFADKYGKLAGARLFELVQGFTPDEVGFNAEDLAQGVVPMKVFPMLKSGSLADRVLGTLVLYELVKHRGEAFDPTVRSTTVRTRFVNKLDSYLERGEIVPLGR